MNTRLLTATGLSALMLAGGLVAAPASSAATGGVAVAAPVTKPVDCPTALPTSQAVEGLTGTGFTVEKGTTPDPFTATVLGRITDGIAPGVDMIMAELDSPAIQKAGVWAGMSGSPVYTDDGRLIGAVAYGLSWAPSPIAGITPATQMKSLGNRAAATTGLTAAGVTSTLGYDKVTVSATVAKSLAATGAVTQAQASAGFTRLPLPVTVSGLGGVSSAHGRKMLDRLGGDLSGARMLSGAKAKSTGSSPDEIVPGGNFAAALSYGDVTAAGTGTTTFVCDDRAVAFGHPFLFTGPSQMSVHPASAVYVQPDPTYGSFKVANLGSPVGSLDQDRLVGVRGLLGQAPTTALIRSDLKVTGGGSRVGRTRLVYQPFAADISATHAMVNIDRVLDQIGPGAADLTLKVRGVKPNGKTFTLTRTDSFVDRYDISWAVADSVYGIVSAIVDQPFKKVRITSVSLTGTVDPELHGYRVTSLKVRQNGAYVVPKGTVTAKPGGTLRVRLRLAPLGAGTARNLTLPIPVPAKTSGGFGEVEVSAGPVYPDTSDANSLAQVLKALRAMPSGNSGRADLTVYTDAPNPKRSSASKTVGAAIEYYENWLDVQIS